MNVKFHPLGLIDYKKCWDFQEELFQELLMEKNANNPDRMNHLIFCEHPHVYTLGKSGDRNNLLINALELKAKNAHFYKTDRGGDITYHGPGQLVGYPIFDLDLFSLGLKDYIHMLEETIIKSLAEIGLGCGRLDGATGVWLNIGKTGKTRKICAIGVKSSHWITMHGFALNINTDLNYFGYINPCGFTDKSVTSIEKELCEKQDFNAISSIVAKTFGKMFNFDFSNNIV